MLNPELYAAIQRNFGRCQILRENEEAIYQRIRSPISDPGTVDSVRFSYSGEEYRCNCPFCGDTNGHLYINYLYGLGQDSASSLWFPSLAYCHHGCLDNEMNRLALRRMLFTFASKGGFTINRSSIGVGSSVVNLKLDPLDNVVPVEELPLDHPAIRYLCEERKYSLELLSQLNVGYCEQSSRWTAIKNKIYIPIIFKGSFAGWQARCIGKPPIGTPKYYTQPGLKKSAILYNYDMAVQQPYVVITEGVTDVWSVGPAAVCGFGKHVSVVQKELLCNMNKPIVVLLDTDARDSANKLYEALKRKTEKVYLATLPDSYNDPAELPRDSIVKVIQEALDGKEVNIQGCDP